MDFINVKISTIKGWTTHMTMLIKVLAMLELEDPKGRKAVLEVGGGPFSTPILHWICKLQGRKLVTYENEPTFYKLCKRFQSGLHSIRFIEDWDKMDFKTHWGMVFIDHHPSERRVVDVVNFKDKADYIVIHDTNRAKYYFEPGFAQFKYRYDWKDCKPYTSVVSNFKNLDFLK